MNTDSEPEMSKSITGLDPNALEQMALLGAETLCFSPGKVSDYDIELYQRISRKHTHWGKHLYHDAPQSAVSTEIHIPESQLGSRPYLLRLAGFRRDDIFGPYEISQELVQAGIHYVDGIGNGLYETLLLCRKYGIWPTFEAPALGFELPFARADFPPFLKFYRSKIRALREALHPIEQVLGHSLLGKINQPWFLWLRFSPLALFVYAWQKNPTAIQHEMMVELDTDRLPAIGHGPVEQANLARFWTYIRHRHAELLCEISRLFREEIVGDGLIIGNMHANPIVDYMTLGEAFDYPGVAIRPTYLEDITLAENYIAFEVQLFHDLTGKAPLVSLRTNLLSAGSRYIPGPNLLARWYSAALRAGAMGFYLWPRDYPSSDIAPTYDGPMPGNPDPSAYGRERWNEHLNIYSQISNYRRFLPPESEVGLLVSWKTYTASQWIKTLHTFCHLNNIRVRCRFQEVEQLESGERSLSRYKLLIIPALNHASDQLMTLMADYTRSGRAILGDQTTLAKYDHDGKKRTDTLKLCKYSSIPQADGRVWCISGLTKPSSDPSFAEVELNLKEICDHLNIDSNDWVFNLNVGNFAHASKKIANFDLLSPDRDLNLEHYFYEHSSNWILPEYQNHPEESFR